MIFFFTNADKENKRFYSVFFNIFTSQANLKTARSHFKRVMLNKCCGRIRSFSLNESKINEKKTLQVTIEFPQVEMKHRLLSPRLFTLVEGLTPKNLNILVFGDQMLGLNFTWCLTNGIISCPAC